jgi:uncharacterized membrane protein
MRDEPSPEQEPPYGVPSTAAIAKHPMHPALIVFPVAFLLTAFITDLVYWATDAAFWADASLWLIIGGLAMGLLAAIAGLVDFATIGRARAHLAGWIHALGNATAVALSLANLLLRLGDAQTAVLPWGVVISAIVAAILGVTGWYGGELVFRHGIGVIP